MTERLRSRRPPSLNLSLPSRQVLRTATPSPDLEYLDRASITPPEHDNTDDRPRPQMRVFPGRSNCFKQPTLAEVLSNTAPPPYTLSAYMAYLSQNHCLETLEFTMDANRYRKHYSTIANNSPVDAKDRAYVRKLWQKLLDAYIVPNGPREVNLPCNIRDQILSIPNVNTPPPPDALDPAVDIIYDLMQESVLVPFLSECQQLNCYGSDPSTAPWTGGNGSDESLLMRGSLDERMLFGREPSPPSPSDFMYSASSSSLPCAGGPRGLGVTSPFSAHLGWEHQTGSQTMPSNAPCSWISNYSGDLVDDHSSTGSRTPSGWGTPMTPPHTPPTSEAMLVGGSAFSSYSSAHGSPKRVGERAEKGWKRLTGGLGRGLRWVKKKPETSGSYW